MLDTDEKKIAYLKEHLLYEFQMLVYTHWKLRHTEGTIFDWNAYLEAFAVHARNLHDFLINKRTKRRDRDDAIACDFVSAWIASDGSTVEQSYKALHAQIFHLGDNRSALHEEKFSTKHADDFLSWLVPEIQRFTANLPRTLRAHWNPADAQPERLAKKLLVIGANNQPTGSTSARTNVQLVRN